MYVNPWIIVEIAKFILKLIGAKPRKGKNELPENNEQKKEQT